MFLKLASFKYSSYICSQQLYGGNMKTSQEYIDLIRTHQSELQQQFGITSMRLFGSVARGEQREGSDIFTAA